MHYGFYFLINFSTIVSLSEDIVNKYKPELISETLILVSFISENLKFLIVLPFKSIREISFSKLVSKLLIVTISLLGLG